MKHSPSLLAVLLTASFSLLGSADAKETVSITDKTSGKSIDVVIKSVDGGVVKFETPGGGSFELPASRLTPDSIERIKKHLSASQSTPAPASAPVEGAGKDQRVGRARAVRKLQFDLAGECRRSGKAPQPSGRK